MRFWLTSVFLIYLTFRAFRDGGKPEKYAAVSFVIPFVIETLRNQIYGNPSFTAFSPLEFFFDFGIFVSLLWIALRANRWWPFWTCGLQLVVIAGHIAAIAQIPAVTGVYWMMTVLPYYPEYLCLLLGVVCHSRRVAACGPYRDWTERMG